MFDAFNKGIPLVIDDKYLIVGLLDVPGKGVAWAMAGWPENFDSGHPFHFMEGAISGTGPWKIGSDTVRELQPGDRLANDWYDWKDYLKEHKDVTPERTLENLRLYVDAFMNWPDSS